MIVVDTNVIAYRWLPGDRTGAADRLWTRDPEWCAPLLWRSEFRSAVVGYLRRRLLDSETALQILETAEAQMRGREYAPRSADVLRTAAESTCSAYDCEFVALARALGVPLVTTDAQILREFPGTAQPLGE